MIAGFLNPWLVAGVSLASVPLIIHLLNRQRYRPVPWAAMRFVLAAYRRTRRRVQLENLLLLLLRMAAVACLALAIARPFTSAESPLAALTESRRDLLLVLDASASTGYREEGTTQTVFQRIVDRAREHLSELDGGRGDRAYLIFAGSRARSFPWTPPEKALTVLTALDSPTDEALDLPTILGQVLDVLQEDAAGTDQSTVEVRWLSDLQRSAFEGELDSSPTAEAEGATPLGVMPAGGEGDSATVWSEVLDAIAALDVQIALEDMGAASLVPPNLGVIAVEPVGRVLGAGRPFEVAVRVANYGDAPRAAVRVALEVDGERLPSRRVDLAAGGETQVLFALQIAEPGPHSLEAVLEGDHLAIDDRRATVIEVPPPIRVLVVDGARAARLVDDETGFLMAVLEPPAEGPQGGLAPSTFDPRVIPPEDLSSPDLRLTEWDLIVLANVAGSHLSDAFVTSLEERVAAGAAVLITVGDRVAEAGNGRFTWNERLFAPDGSKLLPAELLRHVAVGSRREGYYRVSTFEETHPALEFFADEVWKPFLTSVPVYEFLSVAPLEDARVLARLDDEGQSPLLIERAYDRGSVFLWTTTIGRSWTLLPEVPNSFIPFVHPLLWHAALRHVPARNLEPGAAITLEVKSFPRSPILVRAASDTRRALEGEASETLAGRWRLPTLSGEQTERVGLYRIELEGAASESFSVQLEAEEGDLERMTGQEAAALHPALLYVAAGENGGDSGGDDLGGRGELWRWLALAALLAVIGESLWGAFLGSRRRLA